MTNPFSELAEQLIAISLRLETIESKMKQEKRWLNIKEASYYLGYSQDHLHKLKNEHLIQGKHYHKQAGRILFDKVELDSWVTHEKNSLDAIEIANDVLKDLT